VGVGGRELSELVGADVFDDEVGDEEPDAFDPQ
jgi:hypothetical protein